MGAQGFDHEKAEAVFDEINNLVEIYGGVSYRRLQSGGLQWPCLAADMADTPVLYEAGGEDRKSRLASMTLPHETARRDTDYPFLLAKGRVLHEADRTIQIVVEGKRSVIQRDELLEFHEDDARDLGLTGGEWVDLVSSRERVRGVGRRSGPQRGRRSTTALFGQLASQLDRSDAPDPMLKVQGLPLLSVRVERLAEEAAD